MSTKALLIAALAAVLPAAAARAGVVTTAPGYGAVWVAQRWQPLVIHLDTPAASGNRALLGLDAPHRVTGNGATYGFVGGGWGWSAGYGAAGRNRWFEPDPDNEEWPLPKWDVQDHPHHGGVGGHGGGSTGGGGAGQGGGVPAVPLPASLPLLGGALAALWLAQRRAG